jgi:hypothetical protein
MLTLAIPRVITDEEAMGMLSRAYSSLKDLHFNLTRKHILLKRKTRELEMELADVNDRYLELTKYVNNLPEQTGIED